MEGNKIIGHGIGVELCDALGIDSKKVVSIDLHVHCKEVVTATVVRYVTDVELRKVNQVVEKYEMVRKAEDVTALDSVVAEHA